MGYEFGIRTKGAYCLYKYVLSPQSHILTFTLCVGQRAGFNGNHRLSLRTSFAIALPKVVHHQITGLQHQIGFTIPDVFSTHDIPCCIPFSVAA